MKIRRYHYHVSEAQTVFSTNSLFCLLICTFVIIIIFLSFPFHSLLTIVLMMVILQLIPKILNIRTGWQQNWKQNRYDLEIFELDRVTDILCMFHFGGEFKVLSVF